MEIWNVGVNHDALMLHACVVFLIISARVVSGPRFVSYTPTPVFYLDNKCSNSGRVNILSSEQSLQSKKWTNFVYHSGAVV
jgi:hypothetical protein